MIRKGISGRECARRLGVTEGTLRKDKRDGCPVFPDGSYDLAPVRRWRSANRSESRNPSGVAVRTESSGAQDGTHGAQSDDDCWHTGPHTFLKGETGAGFYEKQFGYADIALLARWLQKEVPEFLQCDPQMAENMRLAIREAICTWSCGAACPRCRRLAGIVEVPDPDDEPDDEALEAAA